MSKSRGGAIEAPSAIQPPLPVLLLLDELDVHPWSVQPPSWQT
ncbi:hypothetical protein A7982_12631 [Minicystis rosea]|nr:hypothetical protein A7982_12631 [Minicystis rosea]